MKTKIFKIKRKFRKGGLRVNPDTSWEIIVCVAFVIIIASFIFSFNLFGRVNKEFAAPTGDNSGQIDIVKKERIEKALEYFSEREKKSAEILNSPAPIVDPSL